MTTEAAASKALLHQMIDELPFTHGDIMFLTVIVAGFWSVPPAALFQQLRSEPVLASQGCAQPHDEGAQ